MSPRLAGVRLPAAVAVAVVLAGCGSSSSPSPTATRTGTSASTASSRSSVPTSSPGTPTASSTAAGKATRPAAATTPTRTATKPAAATPTGTATKPAAATPTHTTAGSTVSSTPTNGALILTYGTRVAAQAYRTVVTISGKDLEIEQAGRPVFLVSRRVYVCLAAPGGGRSVHCRAFPLSRAATLEPGFGDQYLKPLDMSGGGAQRNGGQQTGTSPGGKPTGVRAIAGVRSQCAAEPSPSQDGQTYTVCVAVDGGYLTYLRAGATTDTLRSVRHGLPAGAFQPPAGASIVSGS